MLKIFSILIIIIQPTLAQKPRWLSDIQSKCKPSQLCAVGEGASLNFAKINATTEISKIFSNKVKSSFRTNIEYLSEETIESATEKIQEKTEMELSGVEHPFIYEDETSYYAFATLNKRKFADKIKNEFKSINEELESLSDSKKSNIFKMNTLFAQQEVLNQQYLVLTGFELRSFVSVKKIQDYIQKNKAKKIYLYNQNSNLDPLKKQIEQFFHDVGFDVSNDGNHQKVILKLNETQEYFKVDGFVKYSFTLTIRSNHSQGIIQNTVIGRSKEQAISKFIEQSKPQLEDTLGKLRF
ncbi:LPP20 family lipoprotein [Bacteriovoracaceae bacterium]|nr:LPP20 family lipoprotein [Bacteriovoracaceae bacterium]